MILLLNYILFRCYVGSDNNFVVTDCIHSDLSNRYITHFLLLTGKNKNKIFKLKTIKYCCKNAGKF